MDFICNLILLFTWTRHFFFFQSLTVNHFNNCELCKNIVLNFYPIDQKSGRSRMNLMRCLSALVYECHDIGIAFGRCGFAQSQGAYDTAVSELFSTLDMLDDHLGRSRYLCGGTLTLADICLFTTLIRFDLVYNVLFKCTKKKLLEYSNLHAYMRDLYQVLYLLVS